MPRSCPPWSPLQTYCLQDRGEKTHSVSCRHFFCRTFCAGQTSQAPCLTQLDDISNYKQVLYPTFKVWMQSNVTQRSLGSPWAVNLKGCVKTKIQRCTWSSPWIWLGHKKELTHPVVLGWDWQLFDKFKRYVWLVAWISDPVLKIQLIFWRWWAVGNHIQEQGKSGGWIGAIWYASSMGRSWNMEDLRNKMHTEPGTRTEGKKKNNWRISQLILTSLSWDLHRRMSQEAVETSSRV